VAHHLEPHGYSALVERLNRFPQGAPPSDLLYRILGVLFSEQEAALASRLPLRPFSAQAAARAWNLQLAETQKLLDELAGRALLVDMEYRGEMTYVLPPPMAGFFEFSMMRLRDDLDQRLLAELYHQYINVEDEFITALLAGGETQLGRMLVHEPAFSPENALTVLDYERATHVIESASDIGVSLCYCRHKMQHLGRNCEAPLDICMSFNGAAQSLVKHGHARGVDAVECRELLARAYEHGLVQFSENVRQTASFICNCCGCCCEAMIGARRFGASRSIHTTNFMPEVRSDTCNGCGKCAVACPVEGMTLVSANDPQRPQRRRAKVDEQSCLGCGVCVRACPNGSISLRSRPERVITPVNSAHRIVMMAIERGTLQHLVFDGASAGHRALAAVLGAILKLPPLKQALASRQVKSRFLEAAIARLGY